MRSYIDDELQAQFDMIMITDVRITDFPQLPVMLTFFVFLVLLLQFILNNLFTDVIISYNIKAYQFATIN